MGNTFLSLEGYVDSLNHNMAQIIPFVLGRMGKYQKEVNIGIFQCSESFLKEVPFYMHTYFEFMKEAGVVSGDMPEFSIKDNVIYCHLPSEFDLEEGKDLIQQFHSFMKSPRLPKILAQSANEYIKQNMPNKAEEIEPYTKECFLGMLQGNIKTVELSSMPCHTEVSSEITCDISERELYSSLRGSSLKDSSQNMARAA